jgi:ribosomal protein S21
MYIKITSKTDVNQAIKNFNYLCDRAGILDDIKERRFYKKPSVVKRKKKYVKALLSGDKKLNKQREKIRKAKEEKYKKYGKRSK